MDLDKYKKAWNNQPEETDTVSKVDIYKMAHSKSSSIVKWIFIIGILEFSFWLILNFFTSNSSYMEVYEKLNLITFLNITYYIHYLVIIIFLYIFYKNHSSISIMDGTKELLKKIFNVRKTVKIYVYYNLITFIILSIIVNVIIFSDQNKLKEVFNNDNINISDSSFFTIMLVTQIVFLIIFLALFWLFYQLLYGILLRKLDKNYKELIRIDNNCK
ncbi:hypothetical protein [Tenacibaculum soleae]|uniref:Uncharacterized protein n=1 Tax=Tenacibaculum soleae TaxID=447689 RepID=A0A1B9XYR2_9FLAO|nr:hypothetical protein [Tenacibaculum soleae]MDO6812224.1 hypothetical protein [Tenacibaculum soleae]OCK42703.1 hypothetical protein BA195_07260 [Tenacibaculum soleae]